MAEAQEIMAEALSNNIELFMEISGLGYSAAEQILTINNNDLERAINFHLEGNPDTEQAGPSNQITESSRSSSSASTSNSSTNIPPLLLPNMPTLNDDDVRAPILPKRETIILPEEDNFRFRKRRNITHTLCPMRNFQRESELQEAQLSASSGDISNLSTAAIALNEGITINGSSSGSSRNHHHSHSHRAAKRSRLEDLFRPPVDLICPGTLTTVRDYAKLQNRWLIVNLQDHTEFASQILNRDIWSNAQLRALIKKHFTFWQVNIDNAEGNRFYVFYGVRVLPYVCIIDPRTGEEKLSYKNGFNFTAAQFVTELYNFIRINHAAPNYEEAATGSDTYSVDFSDLAISDNASDSKNSTFSTKNSAIKIGINNDDSSSSTSAASTSSKLRKRIVIEASEEEQMRLAIENSLRETQAKGVSGGDEDEDDDDDDDEDNENNTKVNDNDDVITIDSETEGDDVEVIVSYETHLGASDDPTTKLIIRLPDGEKEIIEWPCTTKLAALKLYLTEKYPDWTKDVYKIICPFPRKNILELPETTTLIAASLHPNATLHFHLDE